MLASTWSYLTLHIFELLGAYPTNVAIIAIIFVLLAIKNELLMFSSFCHKILVSQAQQLWWAELICIYI
jgi:hypothetical protein